jgi:hypothetical protein
MNLFNFLLKLSSVEILKKTVSFVYALYISELLHRLLLS